MPERRPRRAGQRRPCREYKVSSSFSLLQPVFPLSLIWYANLYTILSVTYGRAMSTRLVVSERFSQREAAAPRAVRETA
ncbi:hypothetical protein MPLDJ20_80052 [Mesorhizobium plurifarium]|uniref:Uncharacterized protein n=1 Tax=Mesorhizobium plurifarium TaxID=69974 RepID=A0A090FW26_MESPL|nr:hypothetical protein MPLDJ20_80052 [Mesorhizobium plurifarium]